MANKRPTVSKASLAQRNGGLFNSPTLQNQVVLTRATAGAAPPASNAGRLMELSKSLGVFSKGLQSLLEVNEKKKMAADMAGGQAQALGLSIESTQEAIARLTRSGELPEGASPVFALGVLKQQAQNQALLARAELFQEIPNFLSAERDPAEAQQFAMDFFANKLGPVAADPLVVGSLDNIVTNSIGQFSSQVISQRTQALRQEAFDNLSTQASVIVDTFDAGNTTPEDFATNIATIASNYRSMGAQDSSAETARAVINSALRVAEDDPEGALAIMDQLEEVDVTGSGGKLGGIRSVQELLGKGRSQVFKLQEEAEKNATRALKANRTAMKVNIAESLNDIALQHSQSGKPISDQTLETLLAQATEQYPQDVINARKQVKELVNGYNKTLSNPVDQKVSDVIKRIAVNQGGEEANKVLIDYIKEGKVSPQENISLMNFVKARNVVSNTIKRDLSNVLLEKLDIDPEFTNDPKQFQAHTLKADELMREAEMDIIEKLNQRATDEGLPVATLMENNPEVVQVIRDNAITKLTEKTDMFLEDLQAAEAQKQQMFLEAREKLKGQPLQRTSELVGTNRFGIPTTKPVPYYVQLEDKVSAMKEDPTVLMQELLKFKNNLDASPNVQKVSKRKTSEAIASVENTLRKSLSKASPEEYPRLKSLVGYELFELQNNRTLEGYPVDYQNINPFQTLLFANTAELEALSDEEFVDIANRFDVSPEALATFQIALLKQRGK